MNRTAICPRVVATIINPEGLSRYSRQLKSVARYYAKCLSFPCPAQFCLLICLFFEKGHISFLVARGKYFLLSDTFSARGKKSMISSLVVFPGDIFATSLEAAYSSGPANVQLLVYSLIPNSRYYKIFSYWSKLLCCGQTYICGQLLFSTCTSIKGVLKTMKVNSTANAPKKNKTIHHRVFCAANRPSTIK